MTKPRRSLVLGLPFLLAIGAFMSYLIRPGAHIDRAHYEQIKPGMTLAEVEAIIGAPPGKHGGYDLNAYFWSWELTPDGGIKFYPGFNARDRMAVWAGRKVAIAVNLDTRDRVVDAVLGDTFTELSWWEQLLASLGIR